MDLKVACSNIIQHVLICSELLRFALCKAQKKHQNHAVLMLVVVSVLLRLLLVVVLSESGFVEPLAIGHPR